MARVNLDCFSGLLAADPAPAPPLPGEPDAARGDSFDRHLRRARDTVEQRAGDRETPQSPGSSPPEPPHAEGGRDAATEPDSSPARDAAGEEPNQPLAAAEEEQHTVEGAKRQGREGKGEKEETEAGIDGAVALADPGIAASRKETAGGEAPRKAPSSQKGGAKSSGPRPSATLTSHETDSSQNELPPAPKEPLEEEVTEQAGDELANEAPSSSAAKRKPAKRQAKTKAGGAAGVAQPTAEAGAADAAAAEAGQAGAETPGQTGPTPAAGTSPDPQPAIQDARAAATAPRGGSQRLGSRAAGGRRDAVKDDPVGSQAEGAPPTPQEPSDPSEPALLPRVSAASKPERARGKTPDGNAESSPLRIDAQTGKEAQPRSTTASSADARAAPGAEQADRVQFVQRVARAFEAAADRGGPIRLRLHPPELGSLRLELSIRRGTVTARIETETETAQRLLLDNLAGLRQRLAEHNLRVERFDVQWTGRSPGDAPQQSGGHAQGQARGGSPAPRATVAADRQPALPAASPPRAGPGHPASFDVIV
jgi:flagellar hook-length control protein FliK